MRTNMDSYSSEHSANGVKCGLLLANEALMIREGAEYSACNLFSSKKYQSNVRIRGTITQEMEPDPVPT